MPTPSKFTADRRQAVLEAAKVGASLRTQAREAGISVETLRRWLEQGEKAQDGSKFREFFLDHQKALGSLSMYHLRIVHQAALDKPDLSWKWLQQHEDGYAPALPVAASQGAIQGPVVVKLSFRDDPEPEPKGTTVIDMGEVSRGKQALPDPSSG